MAQKKKLKIVKKPYLTGTPVDSETIKGALSIFGLLFVMMVLYVLLGTVLQSDIFWLNLLMNSVLVLMVYMIFFAGGMSRGSVAVNQGEIMYDRQESGRPFTEAERKRCYHPLKGFCNALFGSLPLLLACCVLAIIAEKQSTGVGSLPSWVRSLSNQRAELAAPLAYFSEQTPMNLQDILRVIVRMATMPFVVLMDPTNYDHMLLLERISPILVLIPGICYGVGYMRGVNVRTKVHSQIAASKRRKKKTSSVNKDGTLRVKEQKKRVSKGPEQLN